MGLLKKNSKVLPKTWEAKVTSIQEAKDLTKLPVEELIGLLMTHEIIMKEHLEDESKKKKSITLRTISFEVDPEDVSKMRMALMKMTLLISHPGHIRTDCSLLKSSKKSKKKTMKTTWDHCSESESEVEEMENLGLMAHSDKEDEHDDGIS
ncbi:zf-CCHC domain-containing protein/UBN2 domain-containing protein [Cucumis melo var. makuwa]|uniref:Zf-CCHC domain-containing protein/UBN2 domain-containing protein n=1 Tax=Cucumis melo var. makuwa TaxID=1194695 RepID=A0A5D3E184_CUCMM|nr:zf-CCHC domain-containing protein/UBN2 domain-containing protein [Cucumis melo var. makuwa]